MVRNNGFHLQDFIMGHRKVLNLSMGDDETREHMLTLLVKIKYNQRQSVLHVATLQV